jgi:hypothetical protein
LLSISCFRKKIHPERKEKRRGKREKESDGGLKRAKTEKKTKAHKTLVKTKSRHLERRRDDKRSKMQGEGREKKRTSKEKGA